MQLGALFKSMTEWGLGDFTRKLRILHSCSSSTGVDVPAIMQRRSRSGRCHRFSSSPDLVDIPVCTETGFAVGCDDGLFRRILRHFSRSSGCPGVERHFQQLGSPR